MFARFTRWKVVAGFACAGLLMTLPPVTQFSFAAAGILTFVVCPPTIPLVIWLRWDLGLRFFAVAAPLNSAFYAAVGVLMHRLSKQI